MVTRYTETLRSRSNSARAEGVKVAYLSTFPPRECGIATFCEDLIAAANHGGPVMEPMVIAMENGARYHRYARPVVHVVDDSQEQGYETAAEFINDSPADVVSIQHEFGIYGGVEGRGLYKFLAKVRKPVVTTLHTVLSNPVPKVLEMVRELAERSERIMVMNPLANQILRHDYQVSPRKLAFIHHGAPAPLVAPRAQVKARLEVEGRKVMCTFGLVGPGKGLDHAIAALPQLIGRHPEVIYLIVGETHPGAQVGGVDDYRAGLTRLIHDLGVQDHVRFVNHYLTKEEIVSYLAATDIYITPYLNPHQICSGTLAYAVAAGKAIVSTPYLHARFLLNHERGLLADFSSPESIAHAVERVLDAPELQAQLEARTRAYGQRLLWPEVGAQFRNLAREAIGQRAKQPLGLVVKTPVPGLTPQTTPRSAWQ